MGEATVDVNGAEVPEELEREVENIRENLEGILGEFSRRWHSVTDWRAQIQKHAPLIAAAGAASVIAFGTGALVSRWRMRAGNGSIEKAYKLRDAALRVIDNPELLAQRRPGIVKQAVAAAAGAAAASLTKLAFQQLVNASGLADDSPSKVDAPN
jgi:hypothetical protein